MLKRARTVSFLFGLAINVIVSSVSFSQGLQPKHAERIHDIDKCAFAGTWISNSTQDIDDLFMNDTIYHVATIVNKVNGNVIYSTQTYADSFGKLGSDESELIISGLQATGSRSVDGEMSTYVIDVKLTVIEGGRRLYVVETSSPMLGIFLKHLGLATKIAGGSCL